MLDGEEYGKHDTKKFGNTSVQEQWLVDIIQNDPNWILLGADSIDRSKIKVCTQKHPRGLRWDIIALHCPSGNIVAFEVDGEQHFINSLFSDKVEENDYDKMQTFYDDLYPICTDGHKINYVARISYMQRRHGPLACQHLLDYAQKCMESHHSSIIIQNEESYMYKNGIPLFVVS